METLESIASTQSLTLELPPSCAQFCPAHPEYLVVGTYSLQIEDEAATNLMVQDGYVATPKPQSRSGSLVVFKLTGDELTQIHTVLQPSAALDLRFHSESPGNENIMAVVSSTGTIAIFKLDPVKNPVAPLEHVVTNRCEDLAEDVLFLQCSWNLGARKMIGVTTSTGLVRLLHLGDDWQIKGSSNLPIQNSLEAWCVALSPEVNDLNGDENENGVGFSVYSGGDDSILRYTHCSWDTSGSIPSLRQLYGSISLRGQHDAGVTAILPLPLTTLSGGRLVITGSYDDHLRVFAIHDLHISHGLKRLQLLADQDLGGGVWRLSLIDIRRSAGVATRVRILAACMHAGSRLVEIVTSDGQDWVCRVLARFDEHKSMNYASDFVPSLPADDGLTVVSTSFYDRLMCLWKYNSPTK